MKTNLIRLMAIATLATTMTFGSEKEMKSAGATTAGKTATAQQQEQNGRKPRKEKKQKENSHKNTESIDSLAIWG